jgi:hypothetical protein
MKDGSHCRLSVSERRPPSKYTREVNAARFKHGLIQTKREGYKVYPVETTDMVEPSALVDAAALHELGVEIHDASELGNGRAVVRIRIEIRACHVQHARKLERALEQPARPE